MLRQVSFGEYLKSLVVGSIHSKPLFIYHKLVLSLRFLSPYLRSPSPPTQNLPQKASPLVSMAPRKQTITYNGVPSKDKANSVARDTVPLPTNSMLPRALTPPHLREAAASLRLMSLFKDQIHQIAYQYEGDKKMKEQQAG